MKKAISVLILIALSLSLATSCNFGSRKAKSVIGNSLLTYCHTIYLYEFEDAVIDGEYTLIDDIGITPTESGFVFSTEELEKGEPIKVWNNVRFLNLGYGTLGTQATVKRCVKTYPIEVKDKEQTFLITYYDNSNGIYSTKEAALENEPERNIVETGKTNIIIEYFD